MIVVDTNIISYLYLPTEFSSSVEKLLHTDSEWISPFLWKSEFRNVLTFYMRKGIITLEDALVIQQDAEDLLLYNEYQIPSIQVLNLVSKSECSAYDCEFIALAQDLNTSLVTQDKKILNNFPKTAFSIESFLSSKTEQRG